MNGLKKRFCQELFCGVCEMKFFSVDDYFCDWSKPVIINDVRELTKQGIKTVVSLAPVPKPVLIALKNSGITHFTVSLSPKPNLDYFRHIMVQVLMLHHDIMFVHCVLGESLSPSIAIGYLVSKGVPVNDAIAKISRKTRYKPLMLSEDFHVFESLMKSFKIRQKSGLNKPAKNGRMRFRGRG